MKKYKLSELEEQIGKELKELEAKKEKKCKCPEGYHSLFQECRGY